MRDLEQLNLALVAKVGWRFLTNPSSLWGQIFKAKYLRDTNFWCARKPQKCLSTWAAILECRQYLREGCLWLVGSGESIKVWSDPWISSVPGHILTMPQGGTNGVLTVSDLIIAGEGRWNVPLINSTFEPYIAERILEIYINKETVRH